MDAVQELSRRRRFHEGLPEDAGWFIPSAHWMYGVKDPITRLQEGMQALRSRPVHPSGAFREVIL